MWTLNALTFDFEFHITVNTVEVMLRLLVNPLKTGDP